MTAGAKIALGVSLRAAKHAGRGIDHRQRACCKVAEGCDQRFVGVHQASSGLIGAHQVAVLLTKQGGLG
jgi:hypothetical protein